MDKLQKYMEMPNIADSLNKSEDGKRLLGEIGMRVDEEFKIDDQSRRDSGWLTRQEEAMNLTMQVEDIKSEPWPGAANVKYPLLTTACVQFSARALPNIIKGRDIVKGKVTGKDENGKKAARAARISEFMSYQFTELMPDWMENNDKLLTSLPITGCMFKKTFYSPVAGTNISERIFPKDLVMHYKTKSMERCFRKTHIIELYPNEIEERIRSGLFLEYDYQRASGDDGRENDEDAPHTFYEQHRLWDLDDDGYKEPYIVTYHKDSQKVARIVAGYDIDSISASAKNNLSAKRGKVQRIEPIEYFTKFPFMPSPDGSIYDIGFGTLQTPINKIINQATNLLLDSGTIATLGGGFLGRGINLGRNRDSGPILFKPGEWKSIKVSGDDLRKGIVPLPVKEPSNVLFLLLGMMIEAGEKMSSVADVLTGESPGQEVPATTTLALIEQGLKVFNAVYGRVHRSLASEFKKHYKLNKKHLAPHTYYTVGDDVKEMPRKEFDDSDCDVQPVSDPTESTDTQRLIKAEALGSMMGQGLNDKKIQRRKLEAMNIPDIDELLVDDDGKPIPPPQDPKAVAEQQKQQMEQQKVQMEAQFKQQEHQLKVAEFQMKFEKNQQDIIESRTKCILNIAKAEAAENGPQVDMYKTQLKSIDERYKANAQRMVAARGNAAGGQGNGAPNS